MSLQPLFDEKDPIYNWKNYKWLASHFMMSCFNRFYNARSTRDHLTWLMVSEDNQNIPEKIAQLKSEIEHAPEDEALQRQLKTLEARLSNIESIEDAFTKAMADAKTGLTGLYYEHRNDLIQYSHKAKQEIDQCDLYEGFGFIQRSVYPEALKLFNQMNEFLQKLDELRHLKRDRFGGFRKDTHHEFNSMGFRFLQYIVETYRPEEKAIEKIEEPDNLNLDGLDLKTQKEQILLLNELGVIEFLREKYPVLKQSNNQLAKIIAVVLKHPQTSLQPTVNALITNNSIDKNYPKNSAKVTAIMNRLNAD